ncbi:hypothetical protein LJ739_14500 [Aestuariibacter halophilus]|uniref:Uncharacterized protein n=1 Tax=Fluctibacter halophilus TaxID=226011 RepID=A0ABS8GCB4_9ALTE|nr:hypothetical protein [Aestuariibacter halophilus]MCC2617460.1 hypothetical protein [Aestuariibacter halophilus]
MDTNNQQLERLLAETDVAFARLLRDPNSDELQHAYDMAKAELDNYLDLMRSQLQQRYSRF